MALNFLCGFLSCLKDQNSKVVPVSNARKAPLGQKDAVFPSASCGIVAPGVGFATATLQTLPAPEQVYVWDSR